MMKGNCGECRNKWVCQEDPDECGAWPDEPIQTNSDRIRAMSDEEMANFLSVKFADLQVQNAFTKDSPPTATQISRLKNMWYVVWMQWLQQPVKEDEP